MGSKKQIAYFYNAKVKDDETEVDMDGDLVVPEKGQILVRPDGKRWKVETMMTRHDGGNALQAWSI